jgi:ABC-type siderophore export system fused ATPase/permease subunit
VRRSLCGSSAERCSTCSLPSSSEANVIPDGACADYFCSSSIPLCHILVTFWYLTLVEKRELSASIVFSALTGFDILRGALFRLIGLLPALVQAHVSLRRVEEFLNEVRAP